jgi:hypothetical protein
MKTIMEASEMGDLKELPFINPILRKAAEAYRTPPETIGRVVPFSCSKRIWGNKARDEIRRLFIENGIIFNYH